MNARICLYSTENVYSIKVGIESSYDLVLSSVSIYVSTLSYKNFID